MMLPFQMRGVAEDVHERGSLLQRDGYSNAYLPGMYSDWGVRSVFRAPPDGPLLMRHICKSIARELMKAPGLSFAQNAVHAEYPVPR